MPGGMPIGATVRVAKTVDGVLFSSVATEARLWIDCNLTEVVEDDTTAYGAWVCLTLLDNWNNDFGLECELVLPSGRPST